MKILTITVKYHLSEEQACHEDIKEMIAGIESGEFVDEVGLPSSNDGDPTQATAIKTEAFYTLQTVEQDAG